MCLDHHASCHQFAAVHCLTDLGLPVFVVASWFWQILMIAGIARS